MPKQKQKGSCSRELTRDVRNVLAFQKYYTAEIAEDEAALLIDEIQTTKSFEFAAIAINEVA